MENLHLKNINKNNIPTEYIILQKLHNLKKKNTKIIPEKLITEIRNYIKSLNYKNENIANFIRTFLSLLNSTPYQQMYEQLDVTIRIITLIYKYKLNEFDINSKINFEKINNQVIWENLHKEDAKLTIGKALDNAVLKYDEKYLEDNIEDLDLTKPLPLHPDCVLEKLYERTEYANFMLAIHEAVGERVPEDEVA